MHEDDVRALLASAEAGDEPPLGLDPAVIAERGRRVLRRRRQMAVAGSALATVLVAAVVVGTVAGRAPEHVTPATGPSVTTGPPPSPTGPPGRPVPPPAAPHPTGTGRSATDRPDAGQGSGRTETSRPGTVRPGTGSPHSTVQRPHRAGPRPSAPGRALP